MGPTRTIKTGVTSGVDSFLVLMIVHCFDKSMHCIYGLSQLVMCQDEKKAMLHDWSLNPELICL